MKRIIAILLIFVLAGCATRGTNYVPIVDTKGVPPGRFEQDTKECQVFAEQAFSAAEGAVVLGIVAALLGAAVSPRGSRNTNAAIAGTLGASSGALKATDTQESVIKRCLAGRGYHVLN